MAAGPVPGRGSWIWAVATKCLKMFQNVQGVNIFVNIFVAGPVPGSWACPWQLDLGRGPKMFENVPKCSGVSIFGNIFVAGPVPGSWSCPGPWQLDLGRGPKMFEHVPKCSGGVNIFVAGREF